VGGRQPFPHRQPHERRKEVVTMATSVEDAGASTDRRADDRSPQRERFRFHNPKTTPYLFITPFLVVFLLFFFLPLLYALRLSLYRDRLIGGLEFVGFENYTRVFSDAAFYAGLGRISIYGLIYLGLIMVVGLIAAMMLDSGVIRLQRFFRLAIFIPYAVPSVVAALMWGYLYSPNFGPLADLSDLIGRESPNLLSPQLMIASLANITTWTWLGYVMIIFFTALQAVPPDVDEAAQVDGAGRIQVAWHIKLPLIRPAIVLVVFFSIIGSLQLFNEPQVLRAIAPQVIDRAYTPNLYAYNVALTEQNFPYSAAISFVMGVLAFILSYAFMLTSNRRNA
jgi:multiple sugar transport system permease protein